MRDRAFRRYKEEVKKQRVRKFLKNWGYEPTPYVVGVRAHTMKPCSCWMCGNQRTAFGKTMQELKFEESYESLYQ